MASQLVDIITSPDASVRDQSLGTWCHQASLSELLEECAALEAFRRGCDNLYQRVRALFFLYAIHRFYLPQKPGMPARGLIPYEGYEHLLLRRFEEAIDTFLLVMAEDGVNEGISSALATAYHSLGFQTLANQVRRSVRSVHGNQWMFRVGHPADQPLRIHPDLHSPDGSQLYPILHESTPVRMDLSHSGWSDIFFLGMDYPEGARVLNVSIDLAVHGRDPVPQPPVEAFLRVIDEPCLRLVSVDLGATAIIRDMQEIFDYARDYLGLLKAAVIASGIVTPGMEGSGEQLSELLAKVVGPGMGLEIVSKVNDIPKGSRLAVSTSLLACLIAVCMRATRQTQNLTGILEEHERRLVAARAILGEWLAGSGGGWQDSGGVWPGMKLITGELAREGDPEFGISRGRLLPGHRILSEAEVGQSARQDLQDSLILVHGGMAQDVGPILEMVTEKYLLRSEPEWTGRQQAMGIFDEIVAYLQQGDIRAIGAATTRNFYEPIQTIIPWANNLYTETLIREVRETFKQDFWGFWMLGGMSGGGMGFIFDPHRKAEAQQSLLSIMNAAKQRMQRALPFAMDPVVYDFSINEKGTHAELLSGAEHPALMPAGYYTLALPDFLRQERHELSAMRRTELEQFGLASRHRPEYAGMMHILFDQLVPELDAEADTAQSLDVLLDALGFDRVQHEQIRAELRNGRIGLAQNRLHPSTDIRDAREGDVLDINQMPAAERQAMVTLGHRALEQGKVAVVTLAAGVGSRWTHGAGVVKALHPFCKLGGRHRSFIEVHLAKSRRVGRRCGTPIPHIITTSYLTHEPIAQYLQFAEDYHYDGPLYLSAGRAVGLRFIPMTRDLRFFWEEMPQQLLDEQAQKVRESLHTALIGWAEQMGQGQDYRDNVPRQCLHPVGHWFEIPNLLKNGRLAQLLAERPQLEVLMMHNIDTVGADVSPEILGAHLQSDAGMTVEVITRGVEDRGGGLARVNGMLRLIEGLALPHEQDEFNLSYYNSNTMWINIDKLLGVFGLNRSDLQDNDKVNLSVRKVAGRMPTYVTIKDVKKRWGHGQEDIYPVTQFEKLWGDMTALPEMHCQYISVPRVRGQQLKEQAQLDGWLRDGSADYVTQLCAWDD
ncbi:MAG: UTP--glucose-1-phosphate uridylyltransferase [Anaerolineae bacterium]|nr:UTP--glucose-1-phosphate uridylyltransferase [Anaerolineae bacterium]